MTNTLKKIIADKKNNIEKYKKIFLQLKKIKKNHLYLKLYLISKIN